MTLRTVMETFDCMDCGEDFEVECEQGYDDDENLCTDPVEWPTCPHCGEEVSVGGDDGADRAERAYFSAGN